MTDLTKIFAEGLCLSEHYDHFAIIKQMNKLDGIFCDLDDDGSNWDIVWSVKNRNTEIYAFFSQMYPVALVKDNCPKDVVYMLKKCGVLVALFDEVFSCDEAILRKYAPYKKILDDRFLVEENFSLQDERLFYIYNNIKYLTPYEFTFDEIR